MSRCPSTKDNTQAAVYSDTVIISNSYSTKNAAAACKYSAHLLYNS
jgi:hypothetical protein